MDYLLRIVIFHGYVICVGWLIVNNEQESSFQWFSFPMFGCFSWNFHFRVAESCVGELCRFDGYRERIIPLFDGELSGAACCVSNTEFSYWNSGISNCRLCLLKILGGFSSCSVCQLNHVNPPGFGWSKKPNWYELVEGKIFTGKPYVTCRGVLL